MNSTKTESAGTRVLSAVASTVTATLLLWYLLPWLWRNLLIPCGEALRRFVAALGQHLVSSATISWWLLWFLIALSAVMLVCAVILLSRRRLSKDDFTELVYKGVLWVWENSEFENTSRITPHCPTCSYQLDVRLRSRNDPSILDGWRDVTEYWCDCCREVKLREDGRHKAIVDRVQKEINRLLESGKWKNVVREQMRARRKWRNRSRQFNSRELGRRLHSVKSYRRVDGREAEDRLRRRGPRTP